MTCFEVIRKMRVALSPHLEDFTCNYIVDGQGVKGIDNDGNVYDSTFINISNSDDYNTNGHDNEI